MPKGGTVPAKQKRDKEITDDILNGIANFFSGRFKGEDNPISTRATPDQVKTALSSLTQAPQQSAEAPKKQSSPAVTQPAVDPIKVTEALSLGIPEELAIGIDLAQKGLAAQNLDFANQEKDFQAIMNIIRQNIAASRQQLNNPGLQVGAAPAQPALDVFQFLTSNNQSNSTTKKTGSSP